MKKSLRSKLKSKRKSSKLKSKSKSKSPKLKSKSKSKSSKLKSKRKSSKLKSKRKSSKLKSKSKSSKLKSKSKSSKSKRKLKLIKIVRSPIKIKKFRAFYNDGTHTDFGATGYQNYGGIGKERHLDEDRKKRYIERHKKEDWTDPKKAGTLSRYVLWNKKTFRESVADYKKRFKL